jgi:hypothetical protein
VTFKKQGGETLMTLVHTGIPDTETGRGHEKGWKYFLDFSFNRLGMAHARRSSARRYPKREPKRETRRDHGEHTQRHNGSSRVREALTIDIEQFEAPPRE